MSKIKKPDRNYNDRYKQPQETKSTDNEVIVYSFENLQDEYDDLDNDNKIALLDSIIKRRKMTWNEIKQAHRHGLGTEHISRSSIKRAFPKSLTDDVFDALLSIRYNAKAPVIGYRISNVFYILWIDTKFDVYNH